MMAAVHQRAAGLSLLECEAILSAPLLLKVAKLLATLTSTVIQHSRGIKERAPREHVREHEGQRERAAVRGRAVRRPCRALLRG